MKTAKFQPIRLLKRGTVADYVLRVFELIYAILVLILLIKEGLKVHKDPREYFNSFWNWIEMFLLLLSIAAFGLFIGRQLEVNRAMKVG